MDIRLLGPLEVERDGMPLNLGGRKQRSVLGVLVLNARQVVGPDRLADAVWNGEPPASVETTLRGYVYNLRKALEPDRGPDGEPRVLRTTPTGYVLDVADEQIDARRFEALVGSGGERRTGGDIAGAAAAWSQALRLWRGEALQDFVYDDFAQAEISRLGELRLACTEELFDARLDLGQHSAAVGDLEAFCAQHPERERALELLMLALYRCGRQTDALRAYEDGRRRLAEELGLDPSPQLRTRHEQILLHDERLTQDVPGGVPSGKQTLTFLLGDVERSTEKLRRLGDEYPRVLEEHRRRLREVLEAHGRRAAQTSADEVFAAFDGATDAIAAAVAAQLALRPAGNDSETTLAVRMGLHTGEAIFADGEYVGLALHLAARIMSAAHGGQVLVSQATKDLYEAEEEAAVRFLDTGSHHLKDMPEPVRMFQLIHPELRRDFPPLATVAESTHNLPQRQTSFVGRETDLEHIGAALAASRVVTLTGVGGVGKTRLAQETGRRVAARYPDGVWFCELAPVLDAERLVHGMASTLGVRQLPGKSMRDSLLTALRQRETLVILDNCEHLLEPVAELVEDIVAHCPTTDILATSREAIGVEGERSRPVRSLRVTRDDAASDAMRLFCDRAREVRPDFNLDARNTAHVADICERLDGIPLAIELAAARVTSMSPAQISRRLEEGFHFLRSGRRAAVDRHRTLHGAIDWSYAMLSDAERTLLDRLSVFAGGLTLEAAEEICGVDLDIDVADGLASLVAKSMVNADVSGEEARYFLLETMRQYAQDRLAERGDAESVLRRHAEYYVRMLERADVFHGDSERLIRRITVELDNRRGAFAWATTAPDVDLALRLLVATPILAVGSRLIEGSSWAHEVVELPGADGHPLFPIALAWSALGLVQRGERREADERVSQAIAMIEDPDDPRRLKLLRAASAGARFFEGRIENLRRANDELLRLARLHHDPESEVMALQARALLDAYAGAHDAAVEAGRAACSLARGASTAYQAWALYCLGEALNASGAHEDALGCFERSITLSRANGMGFQAGVAAVGAASIHGRLGNTSTALTMFRDVIDHWRIAGMWVQQWVTLRNVVELLGRIGEDEPAAVLLAASQTSATAVPAFGAQLDSLDELKADLAERLGGRPFAAASERGPTMSDEEAVAYAKAEIDRVVASLQLSATGA